MHRPLFSALSVLAAVTLSSCVVPIESDSGSYPSRRPAPSVALPYDLSEDEQRLLPSVIDALEDAGYRTSRSRSGDLELEFKIDDGPVNADTYITLLHRGSPVARSYARVGGPAIIVRRQQVIIESFEKCLSDFERKIPAARDWDRPGDFDGYHDDYRRENRSPYSDDDYDRPYRGY
jgi:hypothetical protein